MSLLVKKKSKPFNQSVKLFGLGSMAFDSEVLSGPIYVTSMLEFDVSENNDCVGDR